MRSDADPLGMRPGADLEKRRGIDLRPLKSANRNFCLPRCWAIYLQEDRALRPERSARRWSQMAKSGVVAFARDECSARAHPADPPIHLLCIVMLLSCRSECNQIVLISFQYTIEMLGRMHEHRISHDETPLTGPECDYPRTIDLMIGNFEMVQ